MKQVILQYCLDHSLRVDELFARAYANFINRPLKVREYSTVYEHYRDWMDRGVEPPHYLKYFLERERRRDRQLALDL